MRELPESPELVVITIRAAGFEAAVNDALAAGARAIVAITAGLGERDAAGLALQQAAAARCREAGTILVGPNCLGIADLTTELDLTWDDFGPGAVALVSQSGNVGLELAQHAHYFRVGFSRFVSLGNQADLNAGDCVEDLIDHEGTRVIAVYIEDFGDGRQFASLADKARLAGKPVILLTVGETAASRRTARSHTGALVSESLAVDAACRAAGIYRVQTPLQMTNSGGVDASFRISRGAAVSPSSATEAAMSRSPPTGSPHTDFVSSPFPIGFLSSSHAFYRRQRRAPIRWILPVEAKRTSGLLNAPSGEWSSRARPTRCC